MVLKVSEERIRSFIAVELGDGDILNRITGVQRTLILTDADLKVVEPQNIHVTLRFLGEIPASLVESVYAAMRQIKFQSFNLELEGLGFFPDYRRPNVVWVGMTKGEVELRSIFDQLEPNLRNLGFAPDRKGFSPHLTIARVRSGRNREKLVEAVEALKDQNFGSITVDRVKLKKSVLTPKGPIYTTLYEVTS